MGSLSSMPVNGYTSQRLRMVEEQLRARGIRDEAVLSAMSRVPRHQFVPNEFLDLAYADEPLPIGYGQTISQPYIVALMTEAAGLNKESNILEIGTGSGYQAAILAEIANHVYSVEIIPKLAERAKNIIRSLNYSNVTIKTGDGRRGWPEYSPYNAIIATSAPQTLPESLLEQLCFQGKLVIPIGLHYQNLMVFHKDENGIHKQTLLPVRFVPMTG